MPQVPYSPVPSEAARAAPAPGVNTSAPADAFGANIGQAISTLGKTVEGAGNELFARALAIQDLNNRAEADDAATQYSIKSGEMHAEFNSLQGRAAVDGLKTYYEGLEKTRSELGSKLTNPMARRLFDSETRSTMARTMFNGAGHAASENKRYILGASEAKVDSIQQRIFQFPKDDVGFEQGLREGEQQIRTTQAAIKGQSKEQVDEAVAKFTSKTLTARITGLSDTDPFEANRLLEANKSRLREDDFQRAETRVRNQVHTTGSRNIAENINKDLYEMPDAKRPEKGLDKRVEEARTEAKKQFPNDPLMPDYATDRVRAGFNARKRDIRDNEENNHLTLSTAVSGGYGKYPTTEEEMIALDPSVEKAWKDYPSTKRKQVIAALANNAKGDVPETSANYRKYLTLRGMATSQEEGDRAEFLSKTIANEDIPRKWQMSLIKLQEQARNHASDDPRVNRGMRILTDAGIAPRITDGKETVNAFRGALQEALEVFQEQHKRGPDPKETKEIGSRLIQETHDPNKWSFGFMNRTSPLYEQTPSDEAIENIKADPRFKANNIIPSDEQIKREALRQRYIKLYGDKGKPK